MDVSPQIVDPGGTVTFTMVGENGDNVTRAAERGVLGWSVGYGTNVVSGCTRFDDSCTIRLGTAGGPRPRYWNWNLVQGSTPSYWFCGPSEYYPVVCDRCYGLLGTYAWGYYAVRPSDSNKPTASFTVATCRALPRACSGSRRRPNR